MVFGCVAWAAERLVFGVEVRFARSSFIFLYAVLAGLGSFLGGVWQFHLSLRGFGWFGLVSRWCLAVSHRLPRGRFLVWRCVLHGRVSSFFRPSESDVREFFGAAGLAGWA